MTTVSIKVKLGKTKDLLKRLDQLNGYKRGLHLAGLHLQSRIRKYPPVSRRKQGFTSDRQRRGFFAKLKSGEIDVPYRRGMSSRSERLGQRWAVSRSSDGFSVTVGNNASYANLVQGYKQSLYHKRTGWKRFDDVAEKESRTVQKIIRDNLKQDL